MISSPETLVVREVPRDQDASLAVIPLDEAVTLGQRYLIVRSRKRITVDGGHSITATKPYLDTDRMPKSSEGSTFSNPESVADPIEPSSLSWMSQSDDIGQEGSRVQLSRHHEFIASC